METVFLANFEPAILQKLKAGMSTEVEAPQQTVGFNIENIMYKKKEYCVWVCCNFLFFLYSLHRIILPQSYYYYMPTNVYCAY